MQYFFGLPAPAGGAFYHQAWSLLQALPDCTCRPRCAGAGQSWCWRSGPRLPYLAKVPGPLLAMLAATAFNAAFAPAGVATIESTFGAIPRELPSFAWPDMDFDTVTLLLPAAFTIAMLGAIESLLSAVIADGMGGTRHDSNQELVGQGIANILSPLFGGIAATGALARTATNHRNGATGPLAAMVHSITLLLVLVVLAHYAGKVPLCALAAILFVVAWNMSEAGRFLRMARGLRAPTWQSCWSLSRSPC